ncbi:MAG: uracil-DNA glycosylase family protein [Actinomycetota bacterium]|nr:uracil-DNA glycosylase family protein [Actinomycetota bacterium]
MRQDASSPEMQWSISPGDRLFRTMLVRHGFKLGSEDSPGGWRCYLTDVVKSAFVVNDWNKVGSRQRKAVSECWAPVLEEELRLGQPRAIVTVGRRAQQLLAHVEARRLLPSLWKDAARFHIEHYVSIASRPAKGLPAQDAGRIARWGHEFATISGFLPGEPGEMEIYAPPDAADYLDGPMPKYPEGSTFEFDGKKTDMNSFEQFLPEQRERKREST